MPVDPPSANNSSFLAWLYIYCANCAFEFFLINEIARWSVQLRETPPIIACNPLNEISVSLPKKKKGKKKKKKKTVDPVITRHDGLLTTIVEDFNELRATEKLVIYFRWFYLFDRLLIDGLNSDERTFQHFPRCTFLTCVTALPPSPRSDESLLEIIEIIIQ